MNMVKILRKFWNKSLYFVFKFCIFFTMPVAWNGRKYLNYIFLCKKTSLISSQGSSAYGCNRIWLINASHIMYINFYSRLFYIFLVSLYLTFCFLFVWNFTISVIWSFCFQVSFTFLRFFLLVCKLLLIFLLLSYLKIIKVKSSSLWFNQPGSRFPSMNSV